MIAFLDELKSDIFYGLENMARINAGVKVKHIQWIWDYWLPGRNQNSERWWEIC